ncbi:hypothetical protein XM82_004554, partial [Salmonella enterica subsp. enterica serovar Haifa]|nr:hypothetical protein [Salmonella enterica subsp. enterica serovar Haifa]
MAADSRIYWTTAYRPPNLESRGCVPRPICQRRGPRVIIDIHGHYTTAPAQLGAWRDLQIA